MMLRPRQASTAPPTLRACLHHNRGRLRPARLALQQQLLDAAGHTHTHVAGRHVGHCLRKQKSSGIVGATRQLAPCAQCTQLLCHVLAESELGGLAEDNRAALTAF